MAIIYFNDLKFIRARGLQVLPRVLLLLFLLLPGAALATWAVLYSQNSLFLNNHWQVQKRASQMGIMGADDFLLSRIPLASHILNLGSYYGFQEVVSKENTAEDSETAEIKFRFKIEDDSYLDLTYNRRGQRLEGLRFSRRTDSPAMTFTGTGEGQYLSTHSLNLALLKPGWHHALLKNDNHKVTLILDGVSFSLNDSSALGPGAIGFRSGLRGAQITDISIADVHGKIFSESFVNTKRAIPLLILNLALALLLGILFSRITLGQFLLLGKKSLFAWVLFSFMGIFCFGCWDLFDYLYYSRQVPTDNGITHTLGISSKFQLTNIEALRYEFFKDWYSLAGGLTVNLPSIEAEGYSTHRIWQGPIYCGIDTKNCHSAQNSEHLQWGSHKQQLYRILFVGTSQTVGVGAMTLEDTFFVRIHQWLRGNIPSSVILESINMSVSGSNSLPLLEEYKSDYLTWQPDLVVINLSHNDSATDDTFPKSINEFLEKNKSLGIKTVLVQEATCPEGPPSSSPLRNHHILVDLSAKYGVALLPLHSFMQQATLENKGALWWDVVHMTSYGQEVASQWLAPRLLQELQKLHPRKRQVLQTFSEQKK